jgi:hypothetical protein
VETLLEYCIFGQFHRAFSMLQTLHSSALPGSFAEILEAFKKYKLFEMFVTFNFLSAQI